MSAGELALRCVKCGDVRIIDLGLIRDVPPWVRIIEEACREAGAAISVDGCDSCRGTRQVRDSMAVLAELKSSVEAHQEAVRNRVLLDLS